MPIIAMIFWTFGFIIGTITHSLDSFYGGWLPYDFRPLPWNIYWTSLTFLDPLAAALIWVRERIGAALGVAIMLSNVLANGYTAWVAGYEEFYFGLAFQVPFAALVFFAAWECFKAKLEAEAT